MADAANFTARLGGLIVSPLAVLTLAQSAYAETTVADDRTATVRTSTVNAGAADNVSIDDEGSVLVGSGAAIEIDSNNAVANDGVVGSEDASNTVGVLARDGVSGGITNTGTIQLIEDYTPDDADDDGDNDGWFAAGDHRTGILLEGAFTGAVTNAEDAAITIEGNDSAGIRTTGALTGSLTNSGVLSVTGNRAVGIEVGGPVLGDVLVGGGVSVLGENAVGVNLLGAIDGGLTIAGSITATGYRYSSRSSDDDFLAALDADDLLLGGPALAVRGSVSRGVTIAGIGVEDDADDDGDGVVEDADGDGTVDEGDDEDDDAAGSLVSYGTAPAILISPGGAGELWLGLTSRGYGFVNRGSVLSSGVYDGATSTGVQIAGEGGRVFIQGGILQDGSITAGAADADAFGVRLGSGTETEILINRGTITSSATSEGAHTARAVRVESGASVPSLVNQGSILAYFYGETGDATVIQDLSGSLTSLKNYGTIAATVQATDDDTSDDVTPVAAGRTIAIDVSANTTGVTIAQLPSIDLTDDDSTNTMYGADSQIVGDILFGSGGDVFDISGGAVVGDVYFGAGMDIFRLTGGAFEGGVYDADDQLSLYVGDASFALAEGDLRVTDATFAEGAVLYVPVTYEDADGAVLTATGAVSFAEGATIVPIIPSALPADGAYVFLQAGSITGAQYVTGARVGEDVPFLYFVDIAAPTATTLALTFRRKTSADLGLSPNEAAMFEPLIAALQRDDEAGAAFAQIDNQAAFERAYNDLVPNYSAAAAQFAATGIDASTEAARAHLGRRLRTRDQETEAWVQELGFYTKRDAANDGAAYDGWGFGFTGGVDAPLQTGQILGLSIGFLTAEATNGADEGGVTANTLGHFNVYLGAELGFLDFDFLAGGGGGSMSSRRLVEIGDLERKSEAEWWALESHARAGVSAPVVLVDAIEIIPRIGVSYLSYWQEDYVEAGGGDGINLQADEMQSQVMRGEATIDLAWRIGDERFAVTPRLRAGWREPFATKAAQRTYRFASGGDSFVLVDEPWDEAGALFGFGIEGGDDTMSISVSYDGQMLENFESHSAHATVRLRY